jgi:hypothetical protein
MSRPTYAQLQTKLRRQLLEISRLRRQVTDLTTAADRRWDLEDDVRRTVEKLAASKHLEPGPLASQLLRGRMNELLDERRMVEGAT